MISQATWDEARQRLGILEVKVKNIEGGVKPWVNVKLDNQERRVQGRLDAFGIQMTRLWVAAKPWILQR